MMLDTYIFDLRRKALSFPASWGGISFEDIALKSAFLKEIEGHKVIVKKDKDGQHLFIHKEGEKGQGNEGDNKGEDKGEEDGEEYEEVEVEEEVEEEVAEGAEQK